jgi:hypothetical protein
MTTSTSTYSVTANLVKQVNQNYADLFSRNMEAFERFFTRVQEIGEAQARQQFPKDAAIVDEIYQSASELQLLPSRLWAAIEVDLFEKIKALGRARGKHPANSEVSELRSDLLALDEFRKADIDGITGMFWKVAASGVMVAKGEKNRLTNRLIKAWARQRGVGFDALATAVTAMGQLPNPERPYPSDYNVIFESYPFDLCRDLKQAETWPEFDGDGIKALRVEYDEEGRFDASQTKGFGF